MKLLMATAAFAALSLGAVAHANTYDLGTLIDGQLYTSNTINHANTTGSSASFTDEFTFTIPDTVTEFSTGAFTQGGKFSITDVDMTLYNSSNVALGTVSFDPKTDATPTLSADLTAGSYYLLSTISVPGHKTGSYTLTATTSAAPEPAVWALMFAGLALTGGALRLSRRNKPVAVAAA